MVIVTANLLYRVKSTAETQVDYDAVWAAGVETEDRDGEVAILGIEITPRFQIRSRIADLDRPRGRPRFWLNLELGELEAGDITDAGVDETDEWRWTVGHFNAFQPFARPRLQWRARTGARPREQSIAVSCRLFVGEHGKSQTYSGIICGASVAPRLRGCLVSANRPTATLNRRSRLPQLKA